jgi:hypothetical protein
VCAPQGREFYGRSDRAYEPTQELRGADASPHGESRHGESRRSCEHRPNESLTPASLFANRSGKCVRCARRASRARSFRRMRPCLIDRGATSKGATRSPDDRNRGKRRSRRRRPKGSYGDWSDQRREPESLFRSTDRMPTTDPEAGRSSTRKPVDRTTPGRSAFAPESEQAVVSACSETCRANTARRSQADASSKLPNRLVLVS